MPEIVVKLGAKVVDTYALFQECIRIGRSRDNDIVIDHLSVSRHHAEMRYDHGHWLIADLESANGTYVNGQRVTTVPLYHADTITVGKLHLHFFDTPVEQDDQRMSDVSTETTMVLSPSKVLRGCLTVVKGRNRGKEYLLDADKITIGRAPDCDMVMNDWRVAKYHAQIARRGAAFVIEDLGTWGAIQVNGQPVKESVLSEGDMLQLGGTRFSFRLLALDFQIGAETMQSMRQAENDTINSGEGGYKLAVSAAADMKRSQLAKHGGDAAQIKPAKPPEPKRNTEESWRPDAASAAPVAEEEPPTSIIAVEEFEDEQVVEESAPDLADLNGQLEEIESVALEAEPESLDEPEPPAQQSLDATNGNNGNGHTSHADETQNITNKTEIDLWLVALKSERPALRRHAARQLEKLTGQRYDA